MKYFLLLITLSLGFSQTDIILYDLEYKDGSYTLKTPLNVSNRKGYDNQPTFGHGGWNLYYSSNRDGKQTDLYRYHIIPKREYNITETPDVSEYSPAQSPTIVEISAVVLDQQGKQNLWMYTIDNFPPFKMNSTFYDKAGYYSWVGKKNIAAFVLPRPFTLYWFDVDKKNYTEITTHIGRSMHENKKTGHLNFLKQKADQNYEIQELIWKEDGSFEMKKIIDALEGSQDFAIAVNGDLLMAKGTELFVAHHGTTEWKKIYDVKKDTFGAVTRLAISSTLKHIAVTVDRADKAN